jgi:aquaporin Z
MDDTQEASGQARSTAPIGHRRRPGWRPPWPLLFSELVGTALLVMVGLSVVVLDFAGASPVARLLPSPGARRLLTGFLFGAVGALIAVSPVGRISGAHINPVVTLAFWLRGKLKGSHAVGYVVAQLAGAVLGAIPLLLWGRMGRDVQFGATVPGPAYGPTVAMAGETAATAALVVSLFFFLSRRRIRHFTPLLFPFLYAVMVYLEAPLSGTSTNPARSLGPAVISGDWQGWWVYWIGPALGTLLAVGAHGMGWLGCFEVEVAKLFHFHHDPYGVFLPRGNGAAEAKPEAE